MDPAVEFIEEAFARRVHLSYGMHRSTWAEHKDDYAAVMRDYPYHMTCGPIFKVIDDHETLTRSGHCAHCYEAKRYGQLIVVGGENVDEPS